MKYRIIIALFFLNFLVHAETLNLDQAWQRVLGSNPQILAQKEVLKSQNADVNLAMYNLLPTGSITGSYNLSGENDFSNDNMSYGISLNQPLFEGGDLIRNWDNSKMKMTQAENQYKSLLLSLRVELEGKYYTVIEQNSLLNAAEKKLKFIDSNLETAELKYTNGNLSRSELLQFQSESAQQKVTILQLKNQLRVSKSDLHNFLNTKTAFDFEAIHLEMYDDFYNLFKELNIDNLTELEDKLLDIAQKNNPSFLNSLIDNTIKLNDVASAKSNFLPTLSLRLSKNWNYDLENDPQGSMSLGLNASLPFLPIADNIQKYAKSRYTLAQTEYLHDEEKLSLELDIHTKLLNLIASVYEIEASQKALEYSQETYEQAQEQFNNNIISSNDLLNIQVSYTNAENQLTSTFFDFLNNKASLKQSLGLFDETEFWQTLFE